MLDTDRLDRLEAFGIGDMRAVPGEQIVNAVHGRHRNVYGIGARRFGNAAARHQRRGKLRDFIGDAQQFNSIQQRQPLFGRGLITAAYLHAVGEVMAE